MSGMTEVFDKVIDTQSDQVVFDRFSYQPVVKLVKKVENNEIAVFSAIKQYGTNNPIDIIIYRK